MDGRLRRNKWLLCMVLLLNQSAHVTLESIQSSLNRRKGTVSLAVAYVCMILSALLLPSYVIARFGCRRTLAGAVAAYAVYAVANFYPTDYTLIPSAAVLGVGSGILWPTAFVYVTRISNHAAQGCDEASKRYNKEIFGMLFACLNFRLLIGSSVMLALLFSTSSVFAAESTLDGANSTSNSTVTKFEACGLYYMTSETADNRPAELDVSDQTLYLVLGGFLALHALAVVFSLCADDYSPTPQPKEMAETFVETNATDHVLNQDSSPGSEREHTADNRPKSSLALLRSAMRLLTSDLVAILALPLNVTLGMLQAFIRGSFFGGWISCSLGLYYVSYMMIILSASMVIASFMSSKLLLIISHRTLYGLATLLELVGLTTLLIWRTGDTVWPYFLITFSFGVGRSLMKTQMPSCFAEFFPESQDAFSSLISAPEAIGVAVTYAVTSSVLPVHLIVFLLPMTLFAYSSFVACTVIQNKDFRRIRRPKSTTLQTPRV